MRKAKLSVCAVALAAFAVLAMSCAAFQAGVQAGKDTVAISHIGETYRSYSTTNKKGPANVDELMKSATTPDRRKTPCSRSRTASLRSSTGTWTSTIQFPVGKNNSTILAYTSTTNNGVRVVLMADCVTIQSMQEADFQTKLKPGATKPGGGPVPPPPPVLPGPGVPKK